MTLGSLWGVTEGELFNMPWPQCTQQGVGCGGGGGCCGGRRVGRGHMGQRAQFPQAASSPAGARWDKKHVLTLDLHFSLLQRRKSATEVKIHWAQPVLRTVRRGGCWAGGGQARGERVSRSLPLHEMWCWVLGVPGWRLLPESFITLTILRRESSRKFSSYFESTFLMQCTQKN